MKNLWMKRVGGIVIAPRVTFRKIVFERQGGVGDILWLMFFVLIGIAPTDLTRLAWGLDRGVGVFVSKLLSMYLQFSFWPLLSCALVALVLLMFSRMQKGLVPVESVLGACFYLWVPVGLLGLLGAMLRPLGLDLWVLPHQPWGRFLLIHSSWGAVVLRCLVSYGWSLWLLWRLVSILRQGPSSEEILLPRSAGWLIGGWLMISYLFGMLFVVQHLEEIRPIRIGDPIVDFELPRIDGEGTFDSKKLRGQTVLLEFWATWCPTCLEFMPRLEAWANEHPDIFVLSIHQGGEIEEVKELLSRTKKHKMMLLMDSDGLVSNHFMVDTLPTFVVVDEAGQIRDIRVGTPSDDWLSQLSRHKKSLGKTGS